MNPNPQPSVPAQAAKGRFSSSQLTAIIVVGIIFGSCGLCGIIGGISNYLNPPKSELVATAPAPGPIANSSIPIASNSALPSPTSTPPAKSKVVQNLAIIEGVKRDETKTERIRTLLSQLDTKYPENEVQIGDMTAGAHGEITKRGQSASIIEIMEAMMTVSEAKSGISYADAVTSYALLRVNGMQ